MKYIHISRLPKKERKAARKSGLTHYECKWYGMKVKHGDTKPLYSPEGYVHQWEELVQVKEVEQNTYPLVEGEGAPQYTFAPINEQQLSLL